MITKALQPLLRMPVTAGRGLRVISLLAAFLVHSFAAVAAPMFLDWYIEPWALEGGRLQFIAGEVKSVTFKVRISRAYVNGAYEPVQMNFKVARFAGGGGQAILLSAQNFTISSSDFNGGPSAEKTFTTSLTAIGRGSDDDKLLRTDDEISLWYTFGSTWTAPSSNRHYYWVGVSLPPITGNSICCSKCIGSDESVGWLGQAPGTSPTGGDKNFIYQWQSSSDGVIFTNLRKMQGGFDVAKNPGFDPGKISATTWFRRMVTSTSRSFPDAISPVESNVVKVDFADAYRSPTIETTTYSQNTTVKAFGTITLQGNQTPNSGVQVSFIADTQIRIVPGVIIYPNARLSIATICADASAGRIASVAKYTTNMQPNELNEVADVPQAAIDETAHDQGVYPNPSKGYIYVNLPPDTEGQVFVFNRFSKLVLQRSFYSGQGNISLDLVAFPADTYFLKVVTNAKKIISTKIVLQK